MSTKPIVSVHILLLGGANIGQSSLVLHNIGGIHPSTTEPNTVEESYRRSYSFDGQSITFYIHDVGTTWADNYIQLLNFDFVLFCFSLEDISTLDKVRYLKEKIMQYKVLDVSSMSLLVGLKADLAGKMDLAEDSERHNMLVRYKNGIQTEKTEHKKETSVVSAFKQLCSFAGVINILEEPFSIPLGITEKPLSWSAYRKSDSIVDNGSEITNTKNSISVILATETIPYFEIKVTSITHSGCIVIGYVTEKFKDLNLPGWLSNSWAYHSDDGKVYLNNNGIKFGETWDKDDVVGCGFAITKSKKRIFFTKNGVFINFAPFPDIDLDLVILPAVGINKKGSVSTKLDEYDGFMFDPKRAVAHFHRYQSMKVKLGPSNPLPAIPEEMWKHIFIYFRDVDMCYYSSVCKYWYQHLKSQDLWESLYHKTFNDTTSTTTTTTTIPKQDLSWKSVYFSRLMNTLSAFGDATFCNIALQMGLGGYIATSSKSDYNVEIPFIEAAKKLFQQAVVQQQQQHRRVKK